MFYFYLFLFGNQETNYTLQGMNNNTFTASRNARTVQKEQFLQFC